MPGQYVKLIANYLSNRSISVSYSGGEASKILSRSTPQGAVLSPFLWNIFLDPLLDKLSLFPGAPLSLNCFAWADDVFLLIPFKRHDIPKLEGTIGFVLDIISEWATNNKASFGSGKTKLIAFSNSPLPSVVLNCSHTAFGDLEQVKDVTFLGLVLDEKLAFRKHLDCVCDKIRKSLFSLRSCARQSFDIPSHHFAQIYLGAVLPKLFYALPAWFTVFRWKSSLKLITHTLRLPALMVAKCHRSIASAVLFPMVGALPPPLLIEKEACRRLFGIIQSSFFSSTDLSHLLRPSSEIFYQLHVLLFEKLLLPVSSITDLFLHKVKPSPSPAHFKALSVSMDEADHLQDCNYGDLVAYSDGSKMDSGVGAAAALFQFPNLAEPIAVEVLSLPLSASVYQAEVAGLSRVPKMCSEIIPSLSLAPTRCHVFSDSKAALWGLKTPHRCHYSPLVAVHRSLSSHSLLFKLHWVRGHSGNLGNEFVDKLAKLGSLGYGSSHKTVITASQLLATVSAKHSLDQVNSWDPPEGSHCWDFFPTFSQFTKACSLTYCPPTSAHTNGLPDPLDCHLVRKIIAGRYPTRDLLHKWKLSEDQNCVFCNYADSVDHRVLFCPLLGNLRVGLLNALGHYPSSVKDLLTDRASMVALQRYLTESEKLEHDYALL